MKITLDRLIVALDVPDRPSALRAVDLLSGHVGFFKVGLELFIREGPGLVQEIRRKGQKVFLDLKLHDIPNTVAGAVRSACSLDVQMLTLHAAGGMKMLETAIRTAASHSTPPVLLAVTALTSLSEEEMPRLGVKTSMADWVEQLASLAFDAGIRGFVCSPLELPRVRRRVGDEAVLVAPGIRPEGTTAGDQSRVSTPKEAIWGGASYIVVGRPILNAPDPTAAADAIALEISEALQTRGVDL